MLRVLLLIPVLLSPAAAAEDLTEPNAPTAPLPGDPTALLSRIDDAAKVLEQVRYGAVRTTLQEGHSTREVWRFASEPVGRFRVDYFGDTQRVVVCDGRTLTDYLPARREARAFTLAKMDESSRARLLGGVLSKVTVPGIRTGWEASGMTTWSWGEDGARAGRPTRTIVGVDEKGGRLTYVVDAERGSLLASTVEENGVFVVSTEATDHVEVAPGLWLPGKVVTTAPAAGGKVVVEVALNKVVVGEDVPDALFDLDLDPSVDVEHHP